MLNVRDYGATGDGTTKDTDALQQTIERCSMLGGGEVIVPTGNYLTGALSLLSNVTLRLQEGAVLNGSPDVKTDYPLRQVRWEGHFMKAYVGFINATGCGEHCHPWPRQDHCNASDQRPAGAAQRHATAASHRVHRV